MHKFKYRGSYTAQPRFRRPHRKRKKYVGCNFPYSAINRNRTRLHSCEQGSLHEMDKIFEQWIIIGRSLA